MVLGDQREVTRNTYWFERQRWGKRMELGFRGLRKGVWGIDKGVLEQTRGLGAEMGRGAKVRFGENSGKNLNLNENQIWGQDRVLGK